MKVANGVLTLTNSLSNYSGPTSITGGALVLGNTSVLPLFWTTSGAFSISNTGTFGITAGTAAGEFTAANITTLLNNVTFPAGTSLGIQVLDPSPYPLSNSLSGAMGLNKLGAGSLLIVGSSNTYTGPTTISAGTLQLGNGVANCSLASNTTITDNGVLAFANSAAQTYSGVISGTGTLTALGPGLLAITNSFNGTAAVSAGTLQLLNVGAVGGLSGGGGNVTFNAPTLTAGGNNGSTTFAGTISGSGGFTKAGAGTMLITNSQAYSGATTISSGVLKLGVVSNGGTPITIGNNASLSLGGSSTTTTVTLSNFAVNQGNELVVELIDKNGGNGGVSNDPATITWNGVTLNLTVEEPSAATSLRDVAIYSGSISSTNYGTANISITNTNFAGPEYITAFTLNNVNTAIGALVAKNDAGTAASTSTTAVNVPAGGFAAVDYASASNTGGTQSIWASTGSATGPRTGTPTVVSLPNIEAAGNTEGAVGYISFPTAGSVYFTGSTTTAGQTKNPLAVAVFTPLTPPTTTYGALPVNTTLAVGSGGTLDLGGVNQTVTSLSDYLTAGNGGVIQSSGGAATLTLSATTGSTAVFSGTITGAIGLSMSGAGYQTLAGVNTYTGGTTIASGTLQVGNGATSSGSLGSGNIAVSGSTGALVFDGAAGGKVVVGGTVANAGNLLFDGAAGSAVTVGGVISGAGGLTVTGGSVTLTANQNTFTGNVTVSGGTLLGTGQAQGTTGGSPLGNIGAGATVTVGSNATIILSANSNTTGYGQANINTKWVVNGLLSFTGSGNDNLGDSITLGGGTISTGGGNAYGDLLTGGIAVSGSAAATISSTGADNSYIAFTANASPPALAVGAFNLSASTTFNVTGGGNLSIGVPLLNVNTNPGNATTVAGLNTGPAASITKSGSGLLVLSASSIYTGSTTISAGTLQLGNGASNGALPTGSAITDNGTLVFDNAGTTTQGLQFTGAGITGSGSLVQAGAGLLVLNASNGFSGGVAVSGGTLQIGNANALGTGQLAANGVLDLDGHNLTVGGLSGSAGTVTTSVPGSVALTLNQTAATSFGGTIQNGAGVLSLAFSGGALDLSGTNTYSGGTTLSAGTLQVGSTAALPGTGLLTINSGGLLDLHGFSPIAGAGRRGHGR